LFQSICIQVFLAVGGSIIVSALVGRDQGLAVPPIHLEAVSVSVGVGGLVVCFDLVLSQPVSSVSPLTDQ
jgi:hypothetical protein